MLLIEFIERVSSDRQDLSQDNSQTQLHDLRKSRLTLRQLNKLRRMNDDRAYEYKEKIKQIQLQYQPAPQPMA